MPLCCIILCICNLKQPFLSSNSRLVMKILNSITCRKITSNFIRFYTSNKSSRRSFPTGLSKSVFIEMVIPVRKKLRAIQRKNLLCEVSPVDYHWGAANLLLKLVPLSSETLGKYCRVDKNFQNVLFQEAFKQLNRFSEEKSHAVQCGNVDGQIKFGTTS